MPKFGHFRDFCSGNEGSGSSSARLFFLADRLSASKQRDEERQAPGRSAGIFSFNYMLNKFQFAGPSNLKVAVVDIPSTGRRCNRLALFIPPVQPAKNRTPLESR